MKAIHSHGEFVRRPSEEEFLEFTRQELQRLKTSDARFDEDLYRSAVDLVMEKLKQIPERGP